MPEKCNPCVRNKVLPMCQEGQEGFHRRSGLGTLKIHAAHAAFIGLRVLQLQTQRPRLFRFWIGEIDQIGIQKTSITIDNLFDLVNRDPKLRLALSLQNQNLRFF